MAPLDRANVDTDQIVPKQFLKRIERTGFGPFAFYDWRRADPDFVLGRPEYRDAPILVAGANFGCGSSREHAPWALQDRGFRAIVAPSFADIFRNNCEKIGLLPVVLPEGRVRQLIDLSTEDPSIEATVDLESQTLTAPGLELSFDIDPFVKSCLLNGWDDVALTLRHEEAISDFERRRPSWLPGAGSRRPG
jgi:3-isopropylmalate/(R)-2-methylmalate dehydratase small subunit